MIGLDHGTFSCLNYRSGNGIKYSSYIAVNKSFACYISHASIYDSTIKNKPKEIKIEKNLGYCVLNNVKSIYAKFSKNKQIL